MRKLLSKLRDRKGITMTEVIVAMAVVIIITGAAISVVAASAKFDAKYKSETYALNACESAVHCVRFADNESDLIAYLERLGFQKAEDVDGIYIYGNNTVSVDLNSTWIVIFDGKTIYEKK